jgi:hypothetical protein
MSLFTILTLINAEFRWTKGGCTSAPPLVGPSPTPFQLVMFNSLKGQCHEIFGYWFFFHESVSPQPLSIPIGPFRIFPKFSEIFAAESAPPVFLTPVANGKNLQSEKV